MHAGSNIETFLSLMETGRYTIGKFFRLESGGSLVELLYACAWPCDGQAQA